VFLTVYSKIAIMFLTYLKFGFKIFSILPSDYINSYNSDYYSWTLPTYQCLYRRWNVFLLDGPWIF